VVLVHAFESFGEQIEQGPGEVLLAEAGDLPGDVDQEPGGRRKRSQGIEPELLDPVPVAAIDRIGEQILEFQSAPPVARSRGDCNPVRRGRPGAIRGRVELGTRGDPDPRHGVADVLR
jgi:hypothetical protein